MSDVLVFVYSRTDDPVQPKLLVEERRHRLGKGYEVVFHRGHIPGAEDHLHFFRKGNHLYAMNRNGRGHDGSSGAIIAKHPYEAAKAIFQDFNWHPNRLIEDRSSGPGITRRVIETARQILDCPEPQTMAGLIAEAEALAAI